MELYKVVFDVYGYDGAIQHKFFKTYADAIDAVHKAESVGLLVDSVKSVFLKISPDELESVLAETYDGR